MTLTLSIGDNSPCCGAKLYRYYVNDPIADVWACRECGKVYDARFLGEYAILRTGATVADSGGAKREGEGE